MGCKEGPLGRASCRGTGHVEGQQSPLPKEVCPEGMLSCAWKLALGGGITHMSVKHMWPFAYLQAKSQSNCWRGAVGVPVVERRGALWRLTFYMPS